MQVKNTVGPSIYRAAALISLTSLLLLFLPQESDAQAARVIVDGMFEDWAELEPAHTDPADVASETAVDFGRIWIANDEKHLFLRVELNAEVLIQEGNEIVLYLDTDDNVATGLNVRGVGAELSWSFGQRTGTVYLGGRSVEIEHSPIGIVTAPTVSSDGFEIALALDARPDGLNRLFGSSPIRVVLEDATAGDVLPDFPGGVPYTIRDASTLTALVPATFRLSVSTDVRLVSYNVLFDGLFDAARKPAFRRILRALSPDVIGFQEILSHSAAETGQEIAAMLPLPEGQQWYADRFSDLVLVTRYPILESFPIEGTSPDPANAAFLLDLRQEWGTDLLLIVAHPPCCRADDARQIEIDAMMAFVRDAISPGGVLDLPPETPIVLMGDMNLVGFAVQRTTLLSGEIVNQDRFGPSFIPDWDGTGLEDLMPRHVALPMTFTWYNASSSFHPGRLDYIVYTDSVLEPGNRFVLFTPAMDPDSLAVHGLLAGDATLASDHLPVVGDFRYSPTAPTGDSEVDKIRNGVLAVAQIYPNPARGTATISYVLARMASIRLTVFDAMGRRVQQSTELQPAGAHHIDFDVTDWPAGVYFYRIQADEEAVTRQMAVVK